MRKYIEIGYGNKWWIRTELEHGDGTETEMRGISKPFRLKSVYMRVWIGRTVYIVDSRDGFKRTRKTGRSLKLLLGLRGEG